MDGIESKILFPNTTSLNLGQRQIQEMKKITKEKVTTRLIWYVKNAVYHLQAEKRHTKPVFILGYGRSGSSMLFRIFERDFRIQAFGENHPSVAQNYLLRYDLLQHTIHKSKFNLVVLKPILNSFDVAELMTMFPNGIFIWLIRDYQDVVASALKKFGPDVANCMKDYIEHGYGNNWISKGLPNQTKNEIANITKGRNLHIEDWMALVWWSVNYSILLEELYKEPNLLILRYENLVLNPERNLKNIYDKIGISYKKSLVKYVHQKSVGKGKGVKLNKGINTICLDLHGKILNHAGWKTREINAK